MINTDEEALICDLAETYGIFDYRSLPIQMVATLSVGLRANSRIKMKLCGMEFDPETYLLAAIVDRLSILLWRQTKEGMDGINLPELILDYIGKKDSNGFVSGEEFEIFRDELVKTAIASKQFIGNEKEIANAINDYLYPADDKIFAI